MGSLHFLGYVQATLTKSSSFMRNWVAVYDPMGKCSFSVKPWMNVGCMISASLAKNSLGSSIIRIKGLFGKDWTGLCVQWCGFLFFQQQRFELFLVSLQIIVLFLFSLMVLHLRNKSLGDLSNFGLRMRVVTILLQQYGKRSLGVHPW